MSSQTVVNAAREGADTDKRKGRKGDEEQRPLVPFVRASRERRESVMDESVQLSASSTSLGSGPIDIPPIGFLRHLVLRVTLTGGAGSTTAAVADEDAPFNALDNVQVADVNGNPIYGPISGHDVYLACKYGAYTYMSDPKLLPSFDDDDAGGNYSFTVRIPVEVSGRDGFGALANMNASQTYKLRATVSPASTVFTTEPAPTLPTVRVEAWLEAWAQPRDTDARGNPQQTEPPAHGSTQRWSSSQYNLNAGEQRVRLTQVGNLIRALVFVWRGTDSVRDSANFPDPIRLEYDGQLLDEIARPIALDSLCERYGLDAGADNPGGHDTGVFVWDYAHDLDGRPGFEMRDLYLPTTQATRLDLRGTFGETGTLTVLTNDVAVPSGRQV